MISLPSVPAFVRLLTTCCILWLSKALSFNYVPPPVPISLFQPPPAIAAVCREWTCHGRDNAGLVNNLYAAKIIKSREVRDALLAVDRVNYVPSEWKRSAYDDAPLRIGLGQTISAPHMHANAMQELLPAIQNADTTKAPVKILDVGSGSGYLSAALGRLISVLGLEGEVHGIDCIDDLVDMSIINMRKVDGDMLSSGRVSLSVGDGWKGLPSKGPFNAIHVGAGADSLPKELVNQLAVGGRMVIPIETKNGYQSFYRIDRTKGSADGRYHEGDFEVTELFPVRYVPLIHV